MDDSEKSNEEGSDNKDDEGVDNVVDTMAGKDIDDSCTFCEHFEGDIVTIQEFCKGLEYLIQFSDQQMLETLECEGASFL